MAAFTSWCGSNVCYGPLYSNTMRVADAYSIDKKTDDGFPQLGKATASVFNWVGATGTSATAGSLSTCYDNGNAAGQVQQYSMTQNEGRGGNCSQSFKIQP